ncbi:MAG: D-Ala-D-Ala carboxypeptidase family metallohydrolase [Flavobacteriales bacterium]|jgi:uncharacterized protein YcbK (DUF882 family)|nr:D-Ala-D-Ala carboxypeptidase family metallohydrolase [Flavobacteriales bacterium]
MQHRQLTPHFNLIEFHSKDGAEMPVEVFKNVKKMANILEIVRSYFNQPIRINSAYRSPEHNRKIGGVRNSFHTKGMAVDITIKNKTPKQVTKGIKHLIRLGAIPQGGIGLYNGFVHYDFRGYKARWDKSSWYNFF